MSILFPNSFQISCNLLSSFCLISVINLILGYILLPSNQIRFYHLIRQAGEDSDYDYRDSSSDGSSGHESDKGVKFTREQWVHNHLRGEVPIRLARLSIINDHTARQQDVSSDDFEAGNSPGQLLFEFLERDLPYCREPLADKVSYFVNCDCFCKFMV